MKNKIIVVLSVIALMMTGCRGAPEKITTTGVPEAKAQTANSAYIRSTNHVSETVYSGENLTPALFDYPFRRTDEGYVSNRELITNNDLDDEFYNSCVKSASEYTKMLFGSSYEDILGDQDGFAEAYESFYSGGEVAHNDDEYSKSEYARKIIEWYVDNKVYAEEDFETSKCMMYEDSGIYFLRAAVHATIHSETAAEGFKELYGVDIKDGEPFTMICEYEFSPKDARYVRCFYILGINR